MTLTLDFSLSYLIDSLMLGSSWQLVKNIFLKNERTILRKAVEMALALALERKISKLRILSSYLSKVKHVYSLFICDLDEMSCNEYMPSNCTFFRSCVSDAKESIWLVQLASKKKNENRNLIILIYF